MNGVYYLNRLQFNDNLIFDKQVATEALIKMKPLIIK